MDKKQFRRNLEQIVSFAEECLKELDVGHGLRAEKRLPALDSPRSLKTLNDHILSLKSKGFFKQPKSVREVHSGLQSVYHCEIKRVSVELIRLHGKKQLRKTSKTHNGKKVVAYVW